MLMKKFIKINKNMSKLNPKQEAQICHTVAVLMSLLADYTYEIQEFKNISKDFKEKAAELLPICEELLTTVYNVPEVSSSTYLSNLSKQIDTVIRKNFIQII